MTVCLPTTSEDSFSVSLSRRPDTRIYTRYKPLGCICSNPSHAYMRLYKSLTLVSFLKTHLITTTLKSLISEFISHCRIKIWTSTKTV